MISKWISLIVLLVVAVWPGQMQDVENSPTSVPLGAGYEYVPGTGIISMITAQGVEMIAYIPEMEAFPQGVSDVYLLSPNRTKLLFLRGMRETFSTYFVADLVTGECCYALDPQDSELHTPFTLHFSPDGTQVAMSYDTANPVHSPYVILFDLASGEVVTRFDVSRMIGFCRPQSARFLFASIRLWTERGLILSLLRPPTCTDDETVLNAQLWNPVDDTLKELDIPYESFEYWNARGERIRVARDADFPQAPENEIGGYEGNVVLYAPAVDGSGPSTPPYVIYSNPKQPRVPLQGIHWVANGEAILIEPPFISNETPGEAFVLLRDGTQISLEIPNHLMFYMATGNGWLAKDPLTMRYVYFRLEGREVDMALLEPFGPTANFAFDASRFQFKPQPDAEAFAEVTAP